MMDDHRVIEGFLKSFGVIMASEVCYYGMGEILGRSGCLLAFPAVLPLCVRREGEGGWGKADGGRSVWLSIRLYPPLSASFSCSLGTSLKQTTS